MPKAAFGAALTSVSLLAVGGSVHDATALGDTRTLSFHHTHSGEDLTVTFKRNGRYDEDALKEINHYLRDWRSQDQTVMDRHLFDIIWEVYRDVDGKKPVQIISAYRSPGTNAMLHRRSSGVARHSQHMLGHAMDFFIPGVPLEQIRFAGLRLQRGGVGFYPTSGSPFVHLDTGNIRHWPRMTRDQLARVFPDGRTVHLPTDGKPMRGYELALADIEKRGDGSDASSSGKPNLIAALFGGKSSDDEDEGAPTSVVAVKPAAETAKTLDKPADAKPSDMLIADAALGGPVPMPRAKPAAAIQLASADTAVLPAAPAKSDTKPQTPADIINARGFWDDIPAAPKQATPEQVASLSARRALEAADRTASVMPMNALAYAAPANTEAKHARPQVVTASAPMPHGFRSPSAARNPVLSKIDQVIEKGKASIIATSTRLAAAGSRDSDVWMRAMILMTSAIRTAATAIGDTDMTLMSSYFAKPDTTVAMSFADDPQPGLYADAFTGSIADPVPTTKLSALGNTPR